MRRLGAAMAVCALLAGGLLAAGGIPAGAGGPSAPLAWADPASEDAIPTGVPTDDAGVVDESQKAENAAQDEDASPNAANAAGVDGASSAGTSADGQAGSTASDGAANGDGVEEDGSSEPRQIVPDAVFGDSKKSNNLVNPQQKPDSSFIYDTSINDLQTADSYLNDQTVQVTGEVVGDRLWAEFDPGFCWVVLQSNDGTYAEVPLFMTEESTALIDTYGAYGRKGTTLQVRGTFHLACPEHEGLTDLHTDNVSVVAKGMVSNQVLNPAAFAPGAVLVGLGAVLMLVFHRMREGQR